MIAGTLRVKRAGDDRVDVACDLVASDLRYRTERGQLDAAKAALKSTGIWNSPAEGSRNS